MSSYSKCCLTYPSDKLIALSGIAKYMTEITGDEYIAGFWRKSLLRFLPWNVTDHQEPDKQNPARESPDYRAPTWSWLSMDGRLDIRSYQSSDMTYFAEVVDLEMEYETKDTTIAIRSGLLHLQGVFRRVQLVFQIEGVYDVTLDDQLVSRRGIMDEIRPDLVERSKRGEIYLIPLFDSRHCSEGRPNSDLYIHRMLLLECMDQTLGIFERIGCAIMYDHADMITPMGLGLKRELQAHLLPCHECDLTSELLTIIIR